MPDFKRPDTPLANTPEPDYRFIKKNATAKDSADYKAGFERGVRGENKWFPSRSDKAGSVEAKRRGLKQK